MPSLNALLEETWYGRHPLATVLAPLALCYQSLVWLRRKAYRSGLLRVHRLPVPVIVVGNLSVGGTGKTPLVIWLVKFLEECGYRPGVLTRGYRGIAERWPQQVRPDSDPLMVGDEAVVLAHRCACPVAAGPNRVASGMALIKHANCDILVSDDGLQHYALGRDIEIAVVDGIRRHGNGRCLPAGPLREPLARLDEVDMVVTNGVSPRGEYAMRAIKLPPRMVADREKQGDLASLRRVHVHAVAGIGNPERFFDSLRAEGIEVLPHPFEDHHRFEPADITFNDGLAVMMTEKDAVKCQRFARNEHWFLPKEDFMLDKKLLDILVCPVTKGPLIYDKEHQELISKSARLAYPIREDIPVMLEEEARQLSQEEIDRLS
jgi:tetraacyldisaccharide 4'-kinase